MRGEERSDGLHDDEGGHRARVQVVADERRITTRRESLSETP